MKFLFIFYYMKLQTSSIIMVSLIIVNTYLWNTFHMGTIEMFIYSTVAGFLIFQNKSIAFYKGRIGIIRKTNISESSPPELVAFLGWCFLLAPIVFIFFKFVV